MSYLSRHGSEIPLILGIITSAGLCEDAQGCGTALAGMKQKSILVVCSHLLNIEDGKS